MALRSLHRHSVPVETFPSMFMARNILQCIGSAMFLFPELSDTRQPRPTAWWHPATWAWLGLC